MGYPGDQGKPGGWPPEQPSQAPYGPGAERPEAAPYGSDSNETAFTPRGQGRGGDAFGSPPLGGEIFGPPSESGAGGAPASWNDDPGGATMRAPGAFPAGPPGSPGSDDGAYGASSGGHYAPPGDFGFNDPNGPGGSPGDHSPQGGFGGPGGPGDFGGPDGPGSSGGPTPPERRRNLPLIIGGAVVAGLVLIGGGIGLSSVLKGDPEPKAPPSPAAAKKSPTAAPSPTVPPLEPVKLKSRATDPKPLTLREVFGKTSFKSGGQKYVRAAWNAKRGCKGAVGGVKLTSTLKKAGCTQTLRATYARTDGNFIGTVGVLNLRTENAAKVAVKSAAAKDAFLQALPGAGTTKKIGKGEALGTAEARGHYLVMTWVQRPDGKKIAPSYHKSVSAFGAQVVKNSNLSFALAFRETEGKPFRN